MNRNSEVAWIAPTNSWPDHLWIYQVVPQDFPDPVVSNLLVVTGFTKKDRTTKLISRPAIDRQSALYFKSEDESKYLGIFPSQGWIYYHDSGAEARMTEQVEGVPSEEETRRLGLRYLPLLGIDRDQLAIKPGSAEIDAYGEKTTRTYREKTTGTLASVVDSRGVFFNRRIDGFPIEGIGLHGGVRMSFGNNAKLVYLQVVWRNLKPYQIHKVLSPDDIVKRTSDGRIKLPQVTNARPARKLTINKAEVFYEGQLGDETQRFVASYVRLEITADVDESKPTFYVRFSTKAEP